MIGLIDRVVAYADDFGMFRDSGLLMACVSGGMDSMCMLDALLGIARLRGFAVNAAHYNHRLRGEESERDELFVRERCAALGVPLHVGSGDVGAYAKERGLGLEEAARDSRYSFFYATAAEIGAYAIATAHTADDNAETILMNLVRGAGTAGLSGMPPVREAYNHMGGHGEYAGFSHNAEGISGGDGPGGCSAADTGKIGVIRPMLCVSRDEIMSYAEERGIAYVMDSSNELDVYTRNKIRHSIMPVIKEINPNFVDTVATNASLLRSDEEYLSGLADAFVESQCKRWGRAGSEGAVASGEAAAEAMAAATETAAGDAVAGASVNAAELAALSPAISGRVVRKLYGSALSTKHVKAVLELCKCKDPSARLSLPGMTVYKEYEYVVFVHKSDEIASDAFNPVYPEDGLVSALPELGLNLSCTSIVYRDIMPSIINKSFTSFVFKSSDICGRLTVRPRKTGDSIKLYASGHTKTLKKLFIERCIPLRLRGLVPVVADDCGPLAVYGIGVGDRAVAANGDPAIRLDFTQLS
ncbi:MAG: tRNA lysidine(34) synthetase TilS [Oscillospiraceae bacterium]|nr:tRNA lysidine(34) synthetase TilS [Oscillospiraceae bacterium]